MGDRNSSGGQRMPGRRRFFTSSLSADHDDVVVLSSTRTRNIGGSSSSSSGSDDDQYYMDRMREILNGFPNTGPPSYPVQMLDHLYMGNQRNADNVELLRRYGITHVLNCAGLRRFDFARSPYPKESGIKGFLMISAEDSEDFDMAKHFDEAMAFIDRVKKSKGKTLVHCNLGVNRSGAIIAAYLMAEQKRTLLEVINYLKVKRFLVLTNKGFRRQLIQFARTRGLLDPIIRYSSTTETVPDHSVFNRTTDLYSRNDVGGGSDRGGGGNGSRRGENGRVDGTDGSRRVGSGSNRDRDSDARKYNIVDSVGESGQGGRSGRGSSSAENARRDAAEVRQTQQQKGGIRGGDITNAVTSMPVKNNTSSSSSSVVEPIRKYKSKLQDGGGWIDDDSSSSSPSHSGGAEARQGLASLSSTADSTAEDVGMRHRLWTLPRYMGRGSSVGNGRSPPPPTVEVIVSEHKEAAAAAAMPATNTGAELKADWTASLDRTTDAIKSRAKTPIRQLEPVYETKSCNDPVVSGGGSGGGGVGGGSNSRLTAAESMSAKISGFLNLLQPKKPFRSTSYSNVSSSPHQSPSSSFSSLSPAGAAAASSATDERPSASSGSIQSAGSGSGSSTARPLRIYTRSSTDSEIYRARQSASSATAGQFGGLLPRPASKP